MQIKPTRAFSATVETVGDSGGLLTALVGDGRSLLALVALGLILSSIFAIFLTITGSFLPHDVAFLGMQPGDLCNLHQCRIVHFIFHDRTSFGGTLIAIGTLYLWLLAFPLRLGEGVGVVDAAGLGHRRLPELPCVSNLRLPGFVARRGFGGPVAALCCRTMEDPPSAGGPGRRLAQHVAPNCSL